MYHRREVPPRNEFRACRECKFMRKLSAQETWRAKEMCLVDAANQHGFRARTIRAVQCDVDKFNKSDKRINMAVQVDGKQIWMGKA